MAWVPAIAGTTTGIFASHERSSDEFTSSDERLKARLEGTMFSAAAVPDRYSMRLGIPSSRINLDRSTYIVTPPGDPELYDVLNRNFLPLIR